MKMLNEIYNNIIRYIYFFGMFDMMNIYKSIKL